MPGSARFVLNADDPLVADLGRDRPGVVYFGVSDDSQALPELQHAADSKHCRNCGTPYDYEAVYLGHLGRYRCPAAAAQRPEPEVVAERIELDGMSGSNVSLRTPAGTADIRLPLPGLYNVYNAVAAAAAALELGASLEDVKASLEAQAAAFGRVETIPVDGRDVSILLVKNPAGANEVLRTLTLEGGELDLWIALNDKIADGRDVSWVWDADFELLAGRVRRATCSGTRAEEMALRLKYAGIDAEIEVERDLGRSLDAAVAAVRRRRAPVRAPDLHGAARAARPARRARAGKAMGGLSACLARRRVRGLRRGPRAVARCWPAPPTARCSTWAAGPAVSRSTWPRAACEVTGIDSTQSWSTPCATARASGSSTSRPPSPTRARSNSAGRSRS